MSAQSLPDPSPQTHPRPPPPGGGAYLLHLLQQRSSPPAETLANSGSHSFLSPLEDPSVGEEQLRCVLQHDPAVAALGPSHRLSEICCNDGDAGRGILPLQDHPHLQHRHHQHHPLRFPLPHSPPAYPGSIRPDQFLPSHMDPLLRPAVTTQNHFMRPYSYRVVEHGPYERMASPSFGHASFINPNRVQDKLNSSVAHVGPESSIPPSSFVHVGLRGHNVLPSSSHTGVNNCSQDSTLKQQDNFSNPQLHACNPSEAMRGFGQQQSQQFYTQFGSVGVEVASQDRNQDLSYASSAFQQTSFLRKLVNSDDPVPSTVKSSKLSLPEHHGPSGGRLMSEEVQILQNTERRPISHLYQRIVDPIVVEDNGNIGNVMDGVSQSSTKFDVHAYGFSNILNDSESVLQDDTGIFSFKESWRISKLKSDQKSDRKTLDKKAANRNGFLHSESVVKDKIDEDRESEWTLTVTQEGLSDHQVKKEKKKITGWRLKQSNGTVFSEWQRSDLKVMEPSNPSENTILTRTDSLGQDSATCLSSGTEIDSAPSSAAERSKQFLHSSLSVDPCELSSEVKLMKTNVRSEVTASEENDETILGCIGFLELDKDNRPNEAPNIHNSKSLREFKRPISRVGLLSKFNRREIFSRPDSEKCTDQFLSIFESLIPPADEELRRKRLLSTLEELVSTVWPEARLYLFGSCANAFGVCNSDIDICLSIEVESLNRADIVRKLADVLIANDMQNVQALTHARVPIVKYSDPETGISCDVCVNNMLAVVNTKLLHDYAQIDIRLRQLAFLVKHWAKCRQVNETYRGTLSSYAYVLMCIHFLQQRKPPVLPCLQEMEPTYQATVGTVKCAYFDKVDRLTGFGQKNKENLADLVALFFEYWAFVHDYSHTVISIRTGRYVSKAEKNWTRRIGNERHLICIEDPFEVSHDLGRVVDKHSIRVLRDEFQRAARIMRYDGNPWITLFEPFVRQKMEDDFATA